MRTPLDSIATIESLPGISGNDSINSVVQCGTLLVSVEQNPNLRLLASIAKPKRFTPSQPVVT
jgi:hypothetical protein